jgi:hypothetical protein
MNSTLLNLLSLLGWGLIVLGALLILHALFADRARGRRRCPRCWYTMDGVPSLQCPECGRTAKRKTRLFKTRRRYSRALAASLLSLLGLIALYTSGAIRLGWARALPSTALVALSPIDLGAWDTSRQSTNRSPRYFTSGAPGQTPTPAGILAWKQLLSEELIRRIKDDELWAWQARLLARRITLAGRAAGNEPAVIDAPSLLNVDWLVALQPPVYLVTNVEHAALSFFNSPIFEPTPARHSDREARSVVAIVNEMLGVSPGTPIGPVVLWWREDNAPFATNLLSAIEQASPGHPIAADADKRIRVYDLRQILTARYLSAPTDEVLHEEHALLTDIVHATRPNDLPWFFRHILNGRLIVETDPDHHRAIEAHLAKCAAAPTARNPR